MMPVEEIKLTASFKEDRDMIAVKNLVKRYYEEYMNTNLKPPLMPVPDRCEEPALPPKASQ
jgi:hypothetical protein